MGNTADLAMVQKTIIDTFHKEGKSQRVITEMGGCLRSAVSKHIKGKVDEGRNWVGKCAQATGMIASLRILSSKADSNIWESFTRSEMKLEKKSASFLNFALFPLTPHCLARICSEQSLYNVSLIAFLNCK